MTFPVYGPDVPAATLTIAGAQMSGMSGCNRYSGGWGKDGARVRFGQFISTQMACAPERMTAEANFFEALDNGAAMTADATSLTIADPAGEVVLQFARVMPAPDIAGREWRAVGAPWGAEAPSLTIEGERAFGFTGCNRWFATVSQTGQALAFRDMGMTKMACVGPAGAIERQFIGAIERVARVQAQDEALVMLDAGGREVLRMAPAEREIR
jgi:heat shock protein HslJ